MTIGIKYEHGVVVISSCMYCNAEIILSFQDYHVLPHQKFIKYYCAKCGFETLIPIEGKWRRA